eukprot:3510328-Pyramimonas_sp.AAC.1
MRCICVAYGTDVGCACRSRSSFTVPRADAHRVIDLCVFMVAPPRHFGCAYLLVSTGISTPPGSEFRFWLPF